MSSIGFKGLDVWQLSMQLAKLSYEFTVRLPATEQYGLSSQIKRSATSIPANIAEGYGRNQSGSYVQFLRVAKGSLNELETHLLLADSLGLAKAEEAIFELIAQLGSKLTNLISKVQANVVREDIATYGLEPSLPN